MEETEVGRSRINGAVLHNYQGRPVCLLGMAKDVDNNGTSFTLTTSDNCDVRILMREPLSEYLAGLTEVHGEVDPSNNVICQNYILFSTEASQAFDVNLYNTAVEVMAKLPEHYITGVTKQ